MYPFVPGSLYTASLYFFCQPDSYSDDYMRNTIQENYSLNITNQSRFLILPFGVDENLRWLNLSFIISATFLIFVHYIIIVFCGVKIYRYIKKELGKFSAKNMQLQQQFFCALVIQKKFSSVFATNHSSVSHSNGGVEMVGHVPVVL
ncbi:hypothetical protein GCK72_021930 [Caenorhabditis remanei]|uniref:7TM GPCR serpentine receptor class x (Srx) domain-containing protein n=1 Tax=Caenorhabditis remanei TaxID=31234 RepID=A0A6A5GL92_CAERE|nr:hypothetical protein GCK72_021930 [Caenorhabditis remanei]KAF1755361.1 hypothetical protein GCK72_021930 [Caenorhabditis remanei]